MYYKVEYKDEVSKNHLGKVDIVMVSVVFSKLLHRFSFFFF